MTFNYSPHPDPSPRPLREELTVVFFYIYFSIVREFIPIRSSDSDNGGAWFHILRDTPLISAILIHSYKLGDFIVLVNQFHPDTGAVV